MPFEKGQSGNPKGKPRPTLRRINTGQYTDPSIKTEELKHDEQYLD